MKSWKVHNAEQQVAAALVRLEDLFDMDKMKLTLVARDPANDECFVMGSNDDLRTLGEYLIRWADKEGGVEREVAPAYHAPDIGGEG